MNIQLIHGEFSAKDSLELITQMIQLKIKFHENKIAATGNEEDSKYRESRIIKLQHELSRLREYIRNGNPSLKIDATIHLSE